MQRRIVLHTIGLHRCESNWRQGPERTCAWRELVLWLLLEGEGRAETPDGQLTLRPGSCLIMCGGVAYRFEQNPRRRFRHWFAHFNFLDRQGIPLPPDNDPPRLFRQLDNWRTLVDLLERAAQTCREADGSAHRWMEAAVWELQHCDNKLAFPADPWQSRIDDLVDRLRNEPQAAPSVAAMAASLDLSEDAFSRRFRRRTGLAPRRFVVYCRLERARQLLRDSPLPIAEIGQRCGYSDPAFFTRHFASHHQGMSPGAWRRLRHTSIVPLPIVDEPLDDQAR
jgi:AraC family transcriptional regulator, arabinose operon regulatory protein